MSDAITQASAVTVNTIQTELMTLLFQHLRQALCDSTDDYASIHALISPQSLSAQRSYEGRRSAVCPRRDGPPRFLHTAQ